MAVLKVTHRVEHVTAKPWPRPVPVEFPPTEKGSTCKFRREIPAPDGWLITAARLDADPAHGGKVRGPKVEVTADHKKAILSGELVKNPKDPSPWLAPVVLNLERCVARKAKAMSPVAALLQVPGSTLLPVPMPQGRWISKDHSLTLEVLQGNQPQPLWQTTQLSQPGQINLGGVVYQLRATRVGTQVRLDVTGPQPGLAGPRPGITLEIPSTVPPATTRIPGGPGSLVNNPH